MRARWTTWVTAAVIGAGSAGVARAECPVMLAGDPDTVGRVAHALAAFGGDDAACVSLRATCAADPEHLGGIEIELHDAFGRSAHRTVASVDGAVALLVSWSRRPLPIATGQLAFAARPPAAEATLTREPAPAPDVDDVPSDRPPQPRFTDDRQLELRFATIGAPAVGKVAFDLEGAFVHRRGWLRYGLDVRVLAAPGYGAHLTAIDSSITLSNTLSLEASGVVGVVVGAGRLLGHAEAALGGITIGGVSSESNLVYQTQGFHSGVRVGFDVRLAGTLWLELGAGVDALLQLGPEGSGNTFHQSYYATPHLDAGLLWVL